MNIDHGAGATALAELEGGGDGGDAYNRNSTTTFVTLIGPYTDIAGSLKYADTAADVLSERANTSSLSLTEVSAITVLRVTDPGVIEKMATSLAKVSHALTMIALYFDKKAAENVESLICEIVSDENVIAHDTVT